ncbi:cobalt ABC transporter permease [Clostridium perfringens]|uniref:cobalt ABC transporter permease n=1 Tax=Clostridium perfringens TaxID=1502 RepID=UPI001A2BE1F5|nr:cobalt ABC transporter permease [Clostridium perfringens]MCC2764565.1 cobalt ABC transporter permease [Clostridium perfringens]MCG4541216.1 cobalt ABC transporter permease [Clostridium perfringens]MCG4544390.1 cobalt ABC transporter permease [Clostridium perfringens]MCG4552255.1 cobalt ABC transporter permease [Clostridium perfringens]MCG4555738.1 cobalt ABC transporter permease [Clostridium perfringens]
MEKFLDPILSALGVALASVLVVVIKSLGEATREFIKVKVEAMEQKIKESKYNELFEVGKNIWNMVEEKYRVTDNIETLAQSKADMFDKMLLEKFPHLTKEELIEVRQAIAGEYNKGKAMLHEDSLKQQATQLVKENEKLKLLNAETENKLAAVKSLNESL